MPESEARCLPMAAERERDHYELATITRFRQNQTRLTLLSEETVAYQGQAEAIEQEVAARKVSRRGQKRGSDARTLQPHLL